MGTPAKYKALNGTLYDAHIFETVRQVCIRCQRKASCILVRFRRPFKKDVCVCHECMIKYVTRFKPLEKNVQYATKANLEGYADRVEGVSASA